LSPMSSVTPQRTMKKPKRSPSRFLRIGTPKQISLS
jgi:hypothetical protein